MSAVQQDAVQEPTVRQGRIFAHRFAADAANGMIKTIDTGKKRAKWLVIIALAVSGPHQISYLVSKCLPFAHWNSLQGWLESLGMLMIAFAVPVVADLKIVSCIEQISTKAMERKSRLRAVYVIIFPVAVSGTVNILAPAPWLLKGLAGYLVLSILLVEILKFAKPDFKAIDSMVDEIVSQVEEEQVPVRRPRAKTKREKILQVLADEPEIKTSALAKKAGVSINYAGGIRKAHRPALATVEE